MQDQPNPGMPSIEDTWTKMVQCNVSLIVGAPAYPLIDYPTSGILLTDVR